MATMAAMLVIGPDSSLAGVILSVVVALAGALALVAVIAATAGFGLERQGVAVLGARQASPTPPR